MQFTDEWLVPTHRAAAARWTRSRPPPGGRRRRRSRSGRPWCSASSSTDDQILEPSPPRFRFPVADLGRLDPRAQQTVPEQLARRFNVVPVGRPTPTSRSPPPIPFDLDAEKMLAFATGREVRMLLGSPARIREKLDELYRNDDVVSRLLEGIGGDFEVKEINEEEDDAAASAEQASQRPIIRLVDMMLADGGNQPRERHPRRADRGRRRRPLPHRRGAAPGHEDPADRRGCR